MQNTVELVTAIASFRFDASSPESKAGLVSLYTQVFGLPFDIGCGACYNDAWQKLLKWKRNQSTNAEVKKVYNMSTKYQFKKGYPKGGSLAIRAAGALVQVTPENLNDFLAETLLQTPYAHMIEVVDITEKKSGSPTLKLKPVASILTEQRNDGSEQKENVKQPESKLSDTQPLKVQTAKVVPIAVKEATLPQLKKRGRPAKVTS